MVEAAAVAAAAAAPSLVPPLAVSLLHAKPRDTAIARESSSM